MFLGLVTPVSGLDTLELGPQSGLNYENVSMAQPTVILWLKEKIYSNFFKKPP